MSTNRNSCNWDLIFYKAFEPLFVERGKRGDKFKISEKYQNSRYEKVSKKFIESHNEKVEENINEKAILYPDISFTKAINRTDMFSTQIPYHREMASKLIDVLFDCQDLNDLHSIAVCCRDEINPYLFNYALSVVLLNNNGFHKKDLPSHLDVFPDKFFPADIFRQVREQISVVPVEVREPVRVSLNATSSEGNPESKCAYFREDIILNLCYWNWHLYNPADSKNFQVVGKLRRGELFYYFHSQILARYNCERFCNKMFRVTEITDFRSSVLEGYFPKLNLQVANSSYAMRLQNSSVNNALRDNEFLYSDISTIERCIDRIVNSIELGYCFTDAGQKILLNNDQGIDCLGNLIQSSKLSPNRTYYGDLWHMGLALISICHDTANHHNQSYSVMADNATALRDPVFYRWLAGLNAIFDLHKKNLPPYQKNDLICPGVEMVEIKVQYHGYQHKIGENMLKTYLKQDDINLLNAMSFTSEEDIYIRTTFLQHYPFTYKIKVINRKPATAICVIRIFMAPCFNEWGQKMEIAEQKKFMIEVDHFIKPLGIGINTILRRSWDSVLFGNDISVLKKRNKERNNFFGWPGHLLIPKGSELGSDFDLFAMISECQNTAAAENLLRNENKFSSLFFQYSDLHQLDNKPLGFPFDRPVEKSLKYLNDFILPNMKIAKIKIFHENNNQSPNIAP